MWLRLVGFALCVLMPLAAPAQAQAPASSPLALLESWVGGRWVGTFDTKDGRKFTVARTYEWSFGKRMVIARSFAEAEAKVGQSRQSRETTYWFNPENKRIEFNDHIDTGGWNHGFVEARDGAVYMEARAIGTPHPNWRAWITQDEAGKKQTITLQVEDAKEKGKWTDAGTFDYVRLP